MDKTSPRARLLLALFRCRRMLHTQNLSEAQTDIWIRLQFNARQALAAIDFAQKNQLPVEACDTESRNAIMFEFVDKKEAEKYRRAHG